MDWRRKRKPRIVCPDVDNSSLKRPRSCSESSSRHVYNHNAEGSHSSIFIENKPHSPLDAPNFAAQHLSLSAGTTFQKNSQPATARLRKDPELDVCPCAGQSAHEGLLNRSSNIGHARLNERQQNKFDSERHFSIPSLVQLCMRRVARGPLKGDIEILPLDLVEPLLSSAIPHHSSNEKLAPYFHSALTTLDLRHVSPSVQLTEALAAASLACSLVTALALPSHVGNAHLQPLHSRLGGCPFPDLQDLTVEGSYGLSTAGIESLALGLRRGLRRLSLRDCVGVSDGALLGVLRESRKTLRELNLAGCKRITDGLTESLPPGIVRLDLGGCWRLTDAAAENISRNCLELEQLDLSGDFSAGGQLTVFGANRLGQLKKVSSLRLLHQRNIGQMVVGRLKQSCPLLKSLKVYEPLSHVEEKNPPRGSSIILAPSDYTS